MKKTIGFLTLLFTCCLFNVDSSPANICIAETKKSNPIDLLGNLPGGSARSLIALPPISAIQYADYIEADFSGLLGKISVSIYDAAGNPVYDEVIDTSGQSVLYIDTTGLEEGEYSILFTNSEGQYLSGDFVI